MKLYALHDKKAKSLSSFHVEKSDVVASRGFVEAVLQPNSLFSKYPEDFELVALCDVSQDYEGEFELLDPIGSFETGSVVIITAVQVLAAQPKADAQIPMKLEA